MIRISRAEGDSTLVNYAESIPTLKSLTFLKIVLELWKRIGVKDAIKDSSWKFYVQRVGQPASNNYKRLETSVFENTSNLLPKYFAQNSMDVIRSTGLQLCEWAEAIIKSLPTVQLNEFINSTIWTYHGTIDAFKSVHSWLQMCDNGSLFPLACYFCFETEVARMWNLMSDSTKDYFCDDFISLYDTILIEYWTYTLRSKFLEFKKKLSFFVNSRLLKNYLNNFHIETPTDNALMLLITTLTGSFPAVKYFSSRLEPEEKYYTIEYCFEIAVTCERDLDEISCYEYTHITHFLFLQMRLGQQKHVLKKYKNNYIFMMVEHWSYQRLIVPLLTQMWDFLTVDVYCGLLAIILRKILLGKYVEKCLIENIWYVTPLSMKRSIFRYVLLNNEYLLMFENQSIPFIPNILKVASITENNEILSYFEI